ncbi:MULTISPECIES: hypothetical protein [Chryseobacterium]|uniref:Uncharacterized protein n=1 Tax=Chryseobacterium camelliae TaxID=1265445 RepID=A0ABU0TFF3_9FLAO|nr:MULTISPECIES: hypothetical protein [Chryseobacterium]MDT3406410.1 hypothetical protein [Pseudacidovorax intermedius]MDQ1095790.1 hypothetical protein [Chryseobacterium camelliae]MDQ1099727.1 hypothetical protein [Chryseobacterium sp. SORGH_AS_1048]MDR6087075.1 hypothetical protein [Chryseobacterium sp. SORGH_AS_0909]MDR6131448.1 hypothetical protein [Chryseobacterium sp. SORGH_AS_1175]
MKKETTDLQSRLKPSPKKHSSLKMMEHFFQSVDLTTAKDLLNTIMQYAVQKRDWINEDLSVMVHFHQSMRSFIRAGYFLRMKAKNGWSGIQLKPHPQSCRAFFPIQNTKIPCWFFIPLSSIIKSRNLIISWAGWSTFPSAPTAADRKRIWWDPISI